MNTLFPAACAIVSSNYLSDARVTAFSYLQHHPGARFYLLVVDAASDGIDAGPGITVIGPRELNLPYFSELAFKYSPTELCCALKPTLMKLLCSKYGEEQVVYLDSDILITSRLDALTRCLPNSDIVLTPHLLEPIPDDGMLPGEKEILEAGAHNLGFIAIRKSHLTGTFLDWWEARLRDGGFIEFSQGLLTDQRWIDLVPSLFHATLLKDETYNVAYWNIHSRKISREGDTYFVNRREPLAFFHFSGFDPAKPTVFSKHQNRTSIREGTGLADIVALYVDLQMQHGFNVWRKQPYGFGSFDDGTAISAPIRRVYMQLDASQKEFFGNPFRTGSGSFLEWATRPDTLSRALSPFLKSVYELRKDVAAAFPDVNGKDRNGFLDWACADGAREFKYDPVAMHIKPDQSRTIHSAQSSLKCSVIVPVYNNASLTRSCLDLVLEKNNLDFAFEVIVCNDGSSHETAALLATYGNKIQIITHHSNSGFARACNDAAAGAAGEYLVFLNNDTIPQEGWLAALVRYADGHSEAAVVGSKLLFPNGTIQHAGFVICEDRVPRHVYVGFPADHPCVNRSRKYQAVTGACMLVRHKDFSEVGGFDTAYKNGCEDVDLCLKLGARGREVHYCHESVLIHLESASRDSSRSQNDTHNSQIFRERWSQRVQPDEFELYVRDELLKIDYRALYPLVLSIAPALAVLNNADSGHEAARLIQARANQVIGLVKDNIRLTIKAREAEFRLSLRRPAEQPLPDSAFEDPSAPIQSPRIVARGQNLWLSERPTTRLISIVMPVKNGAAKLRKLLPAVLAQNTRDLIEIIAIDSASTDESVQLLKEANATVVSIDPRTFNHGLTRNLAARYAKGSILVFINQSTEPANDQWLANLVRPFDLDTSLAGVCSRMLPRPEADFLNAKDIARNINASTERVVTRITDRQAYASLSPENLRLFVNFHSLSAAIRADIFKQIPFREANFAEDLIWGREAVEAGFTIQFEPSSVALHSHNYSIMDIFRRNFDDGLACQRICGRTLAENTITPAIVHEVRDDWRYLRDECRLQGSELEEWQLVAAMRRTAQLFGHWIGVHYEAALKHPAGLASMLSITEQIKAGAKTEQPEEFLRNASAAG
jgi:GT2 family glycosyltransferase